MWSIQNQPDVEKRVKKFGKKWSRELTNVFANLDALLAALNYGTRSEQLKKLGFVHSEPTGILAIDQSGPSKGGRLKQFRLYVYPDENDCVLHIITLGDKVSQRDDLRTGKRFVETLSRDDDR